MTTALGSADEGGAAVGSATDGNRSWIYGWVSELHRRCTWKCGCGWSAVGSTVEANRTWICGCLSPHMELRFRV
ncbi:hypothetical protein LR48_Vigan08g088700 [Vigna angularis]|uniref:Uncharacterized protein n=1 Tax=Phaseolus angularis TaxID=3914 RepID=A0A0L9V4Q9_PHAAN|nr:hypothetical protein LR48_Vigan08g088700 [Vigna angularis]